VRALVVASSLVLASGIASGIGSGIARADESSADASTEYDLGAKDLDAKLYGSAAAHFARADELAPNPMVLDLALRAVVRSNAGPLAMELADRADGRRVDAAIAAQARARFALTTGRILVRCPTGSTCSARIDDRIVPNDVPRWVATGEHSVELEVDGHVDRNTLRVDPGGLLDVRPLTLRVPPTRVVESPRRAVTTSHVPPVVYGFGVGALVGFGLWGSFGISGLYGSPSLHTLKACNPYCAQSDANSVHRKLLVADIGFGIGAASTALAIVLYLTLSRIPDGDGPTVNLDAHGVYASYTWSR